MEFLEILFFWKNFRRNGIACTLHVTPMIHPKHAKFTGKHLCQSLFFNKVEGLRPATLLKKRLWHSCFPVNFVEPKLRGIFEF